MADSKKYNGSQWEHSLRKLTTATEVVENPLYSEGTAITAYTIKGNTTQSGTPTPSNPVEVNGVGERTENLWSGDVLKKLIFDVGYYRNSDVNSNVIYIPVIGGNTYTFSISNIVQGTSFTSVCSIDKPAVDGTYIVNGTNTFIRHGEVTTFTRTIPDGANWWAIQIRSLNNLSNNIMINEGSTPLPYEPYGYKIPISNGQQTTNIYLGSTQTVRQIEKITFDGSDDEGWYLERVNSYGIANFRLSNAVRSLKSGGLYWLSNRFVSQSSLIAQTETEGILLNVELKCYIRINSTTASTQTAFKQWLSENPVDLYYVLATAETVTVNEPLMKIGTYADTLNNATSIPTTEGANNITVDTTVQPSEFTATWTGWHNSSVKEWDGSEWQ